MQMTPELALELTRFRPINDRAQQSGNQQDLHDALRNGHSIVRNNSMAFADSFANRLCLVALSVQSGRVNFHFKDKEEVAQAYKMAVVQAIDERLAEAISIASLNLLLHDLRYPSSFKDDDECIAATLMIANSIYGFRRDIANEFLQNAREHVDKSAVKIHRQIVIGAVILVGAIAFAWFRLS